LSNGKRYIDAFSDITQFPQEAQSGAMAWAEDTNTMYFWAGGWNSFPQGESIFNLLTYDTVKAVDILDIGTVYEPIITLDTPERPAGKFVLGISLTWTFPDTNDSVYLRWRIDGGAWVEYVSEPADITDNKPTYYEFPNDYPAGFHKLEVQARKEDGQAAQFNIDYIDLFFQRVGLTS
jgi:hypothetical protein